MESGALRSDSELVVAAERLLPSDHKLIAITGSGTEAIECFYDLARAHAAKVRGAGSRTADVQLLFFRGTYVGGAHGLHGAGATRAAARSRRSGGPDALVGRTLVPRCPDSLSTLARSMQRGRTGQRTSGHQGHTVHTVCASLGSSRGVSAFAVTHAYVPCRHNVEFRSAAYRYRGPQLAARDRH